MQALSEALLFPFAAEAALIAAAFAAVTAQDIFPILFVITGLTTTLNLFF